MAEEAADPERAFSQQENADPEEDSAEAAEGHQAYADPSQSSIRTASPSLRLRSALLSSAKATLGQWVRRSPVISPVAKEFCQDLEAVLQIFSSAGGVEILQVQNCA